MKNKISDDKLTTIDTKMLTDIISQLNRKASVVIDFVVKNTDPRTNYFIYSYNQIAKELNMHKQTIANIMTMLIKANLIKFIKNGVYVVNPNLVYKGNEENKKEFLKYYYSL